MQQDIKEKLKNYKASEIKLSEEHATKFEALLNNELHQKKPKNKTLKWLSIAASIVLLLSLGIQFYPIKSNESTLVETDVDSVPKQITLGTISPEFNIIETYYTNSINLEISQLDFSEENKDIVDDYLLKISNLTQEYKLLTQELNTNGVNDATIDALIRNLQLRLQLLQRLRKQLHELKNLNTKQNESQII